MAKQAVKENSKVTRAEAHINMIRISPRKLRLVTNMVKNMWADEAIAQLKFTNKKAAKLVHDAIKSAMANAVNNFSLSKDHLYITSITADMGPVLKRFMPRAQGRATPIRKPTSHLHVVLEERKQAKRGKAFDVLFKGKKKAEVIEGKEENVETDDKPQLKSQVTKTERQVKDNKVSNKRRIFNRKSGV
jgi:large subunit ribosomal protein L22